MVDWILWLVGCGGWFFLFFVLGGGGWRWLVVGVAVGILGCGMRKKDEM